MRRKISASVIVLAITGLAFLSCQSEYAKLEKAELAKGVRYDSLFFGIGFGQSKKAFYDLCWEKNREGLFSSGGPNNFVKYSMSADSSMTRDIEMYFYPEFDEQENITGMEMEYKFRAWSPWNEDLMSNELLPVLKDTLLSWYGGNEFIQIAGETDSESIWVKVDGNRRIAMKPKDDERLVVKIVDLTAIK